MNTLRPGGLYVLTFQSVNFHPTDGFLLDDLKKVPGVAVRNIDWLGGVAGLFSNSLQVTMNWYGANGADVDTVGKQMAAAMSGLLGRFTYQGAVEAGTGGTHGNPPNATSPVTIALGAGLAGFVIFALMVRR